MPDDDPIPSADGKFHWKIRDGPGIHRDEENERWRGHYPPGAGRKLVKAIGLDGESFKHVVASAASASGSAALSAASASGSAAMAVGGYIASSALKNVKATLSGIAYATPRMIAGVSAGAAYATPMMISGVFAGAFGVSAGSSAIYDIARQGMLAKPLTPEEYHEMEEQVRLINEGQRHNTALSLLEENARRAR